MVTSSIIKHLLSDDDSLESYSKRKLVPFADVKRRMLLLERKDNCYIPDHYYRLNQEKTFVGIESLTDVLSKGLNRIAEEHLLLRRNRIHVKQEKQNDWQELITRIPPLVLQAAFLSREKPLLDTSADSIRQYFKTVILPNARYTALPYPYIPQLDLYVDRECGFHDLHMHLNGSTETDIVWQDFLNSPEKMYQELHKKVESGNGSGFVKEQLEQESHLIAPLDLRRLLFIARRLRNRLFLIIFHGEELEDDEPVKSQEQLLARLVDIDLPCGRPLGDAQKSPFSDFFDDEIWVKYPMAVECLMYVLVFTYLDNQPIESCAWIFHFYLLILGLVNRLLVQQTNQYGFEQFQKITLNELRTESEKNYRKRFLQLSGNELRNIRFLEGRFSPKNSEYENMRLLTNIERGWESLINYYLQIKPDIEPPELKLIAHFIKEKDSTLDSGIRHKELRKSLWQKAIVLTLMKKNNLKWVEKFVGVDAAASEFDTPPEVFAPTFRMLRRQGFRYFTYHAGEDFFHIVSGLRTIYEAIEYLDMEHGDRIGHAVASGIDVQVWINNTGRRILMRQGEYLDDLIFAYYLISEKNIEQLKPQLPQLAIKINEYSFAIYGKYYSVAVLIEAWKLRKYCPMLLLTSEKKCAESYFVFSEAEWWEINAKISDKENNPQVEIIRKYHEKENREKYDKIIEIKCLELLNVDAITILQQTVLKHMHQKEIVIETLPTSNVRIGHHHNFDTYHLWNWVRWQKEGKSIPPIVLGTDDPGIFATNVYNEYANIYCYLTYQCKMTHGDAMDLIDRLDRNASIYKFS